MKIALENTDKLVKLNVAGQDVPARIWQGETESGIPVHAYVTLIVPEIPESDPRIDELTQDFERELERREPPRPTVKAIPARLIL